MEYLADFDVELAYHPGKANVVADALSRKKVEVCALFSLVAQFADLHISVNDGSSRSKEFVATSGRNESLLERIRRAQKMDPMLQDVLRDPEFYKEQGYRVENELVMVGNRLTIPRDPSIRGEILDQAHKSKLAVHPGATKMYHNLKPMYHWPGMKKHIAEYVNKCLTCQQVKAEHRYPSGKLQPLPIPEWKWDKVTMDFIVGLPRTQRGHDAVWVIVDRLTKSAHFLPIRESYNMEKLAQLYVDEIVRLHGVPQSIVSDRDPRFTSRFWQSFQQALGTKTHMSTAYHPQTDGQSERTIQTLEDMLRSCMLDWGGSWDRHLPLVEFAYNNGFHTSLGISPFEALYGRPCRTPLCWTEIGERTIVGPELVDETSRQVRLIREKLKAAQSRQKSYADKRRKALEFEVGDHVFLRVQPMKGRVRFGMSGKLKPRYIGPFEILERIGPVAYRLALPPEMEGVHNVFHVSMLRKYEPDPTHILDFQDLDLQSDITFEDEPIQIVDRKIKELRRKQIPLVKVLWRHHGVEEATWEPEAEMQAKYPHLFG